VGDWANKAENIVVTRATKIIAPPSATATACYAKTHRGSRGPRPARSQRLTQSMR